MRHAIQTIVGFLIVPGTTLFLVPFLLLAESGQNLSRPMGIIKVLSIVPASVGLFMMAWVAYMFVTKGRGTPIPFDPPREFVAEGLFRYLRNPMYFGLLLVILSEAVFFRSWVLALYAAAVWAVVHTFLVVVEEPQLKRRFGEPYTSYLSTTPRWIPRRRPPANSQ